MTAPGCSGREARAGCAAGCGSAVCRERRKGQGLRDKAMTPPTTQLGASGRAGCFGLLREANRAEHPTWQGHPHAAHHSPRQGQQRGTNRPTHNVVITCREDSKLLTADCCLTALLTCCSLSSSYLLQQLGIFKLLSYFTEYWTRTYNSLANTQDTADTAKVICV